MSLAEASWSPIFLQNGVACFNGTEISKGMSPVDSMYRTTIVHIDTWADILSI